MFCGLLVALYPFLFKSKLSVFRKSFFFSKMFYHAVVSVKTHTHTHFTYSNSYVTLFCLIIQATPACMLSHFRHVPLFVTPWTVACQASLSMRLCRQEYWSGVPCSLPGDLPDPGTEPASLVSPALAGGLFITSATWETQAIPTLFIKNNACIKLLLLPE